MRGNLRISVGRDGSADCDLFIEFQSGSYAGRGSAGFNVREIERFANGLAAYPIRGPVELRGGFWDPTERRIEHEHLYVAVYPVGSIGRIGVKVRAATPIHRDERPEQRHSAEIELLTEYEQLRAFSSALTEVLRGDREYADLQGNDF